MTLAEAIFLIMFAVFICAVIYVLHRRHGAAPASPSELISLVHGIVASKLETERPKVIAATTLALDRMAQAKAPPPISYAFPLTEPKVTK